MPYNPRRALSSISTSAGIQQKQFMQNSCKETAIKNTDAGKAEAALHSTTKASPKPICMHMWA